jgi:hypothetical protein
LVQHQQWNCGSIGKRHGIRIHQRNLNWLEEVMSSKIAKKIPYYLNNT